MACLNVLVLISAKPLTFSHKTSFSSFQSFGICQMCVFVCLFWGHTQRCSGVTAPRNHSWPSMGEHMGSQRSNLGARQTPCLMWVQGKLPALLLQTQHQLIFFTQCLFCHLKKYLLMPAQKDKLLNSF